MNNKGFTLIELIVVIAMMSVIVGSSISLFGSVSNQKIKNFTSTFDDMVSQCKVETASGTPKTALELQVTNGEYRAVIYKNYGETNQTVIKDVFLGKDSLICEVNSYAFDFQATGDNAIVFYFDRTTGEMTVDASCITGYVVPNEYKSKTEIAVCQYENQIKHKVQIINRTGYHKIVR